jgi:hypothetical protein
MLGVYNRRRREQKWCGFLEEIQRSVSMEQTVFIICMFFGVASVALIAFTLLGIVLGRIKV